MGILNVTPDSFFDGGKYQNETAILKQTEKMLQEGAHIIDVGGMSSRPGAKLISAEEELDRVLPAVKLIKKHFPNVLLSIDTVWSKVAIQAVEVGVSLVNDISAGQIDDTLFETVAALDVPYILMHMQGTPHNMQQNPHYQDVLKEVLDFFIAKIAKLRTYGQKDIILDVGFGFGKSIRDNYQLLKELHVFQMLELPILVGLSRKSMIYKVLKTTPDKALNGTTALHMIALQQGAKILRVHDVAAAQEAIQLWQQLETPNH